MLQVVKNINEKTKKVMSEKEKYIEDILTEDGYKVPVHKLGAKIFADIPFPDDMTDSEIGKMARLAKLMVADSNMLGYRARAGIKAYTYEQIIQIVGLSHKRGKEFMDKMKRLKVIMVSKRTLGEITQDEHYINPAYFFSGRRIHMNLYLLFREALDPVLPEWVRKEFWKAAMLIKKPEDVEKPVDIKKAVRQYKKSRLREKRDE